MKKILSIALIAIVLSTVVVDTINAARTTITTGKKGRGKRRAGAGGRGRRAAAIMRKNAKAVQVVLETIKTSNDPKIQAEAKKTANELAKELLDGLQNRTWAGDVFGKYSPEQVEAAGGKYTNLEIQRTALMRDIETKQAELDAMSEKSWMFWTKAGGGKEEAHKVASQELAELKSTLKDVNKAMRNQAVIAGKEYCATIKMAVGALTAAGVAGLAYGIDKYKYEGAGMAAIKSEYGVAKEEGFYTYGKRRGGEAYEYVAGKVSDMGTYTTDKLAAIREYVKGLYGSKADTPEDVLKKQQEAEAAAKALEAAQTKADKTGSSKDQDNVEKKEEILAGKEAALEAAVNNNPPANVTE